MVITPLSSEQVKLLVALGAVDPSDVPASLGVGDLEDSGPNRGDVVALSRLGATLDQASAFNRQGVRFGGVSPLSSFDSVGLALVERIAGLSSMEGVYEEVDPQGKPNRNNRAAHVNIISSLIA